MTDFELDFHEIQSCSTNFRKELVNRLTNAISANKCTESYVVYFTVNIINSPFVDADRVCLRGDRGRLVAKVVYHKSEGRWFDPSWCHWIFHWHKFECIGTEYRQSGSILTRTTLFFENLNKNTGDRGGTVVKVLCHKSEGRWFDPSWCQWIFHWHKILPISLLPWGRLSL